jgi:tetratricopeptide (TPR) repeat protein
LLWYGKKAMRAGSGWVGCLLVVCGLVVAGPAALADDASRARELFKKGQAHYAVGEYEEAADAYQSAYKLKPDPALLFNAAQAFRLGGKLDRALTLYRNYLRFYPGAANTDSVQSQIAKLEKQIETERAAASAPPAVSPPLEPAPIVTALPPPAAAPPASAEAPLLSATAPPPEPEPRPLYKKAWFWGVVGGVAAAGVVVAVVLASGGGGGAWNNLPEVRELRSGAVARW